MGDKDTATRLGVGYAAIMSTIAAFRSHTVKAAEGEFALDQETKDLLAAIAEGCAGILTGLSDIIQAIDALSVNVQGYPPNADFVSTTRVVCTAVNQAYPLPEMDVPDDFSVLVKAWPLNAVGSLIYVATNPAPNAQMSWPLVPNESLPYRLKTTKLWVFSNVAGSEAVITVEQRK